MSTFWLLWGPSAHPIDPTTPVMLWKINSMDTDHFWYEDFGTTSFPLLPSPIFYNVGMPTFWLYGPDMSIFGTQTKFPQPFYVTNR